MGRKRITDGPRSGFGIHEGKEYPLHTFYLDETHELLVPLDSPERLAPVNLLFKHFRKTGIVVPFAVDAAWFTFGVDGQRITILLKGDDS